MISVNHTESFPDAIPTGAEPDVGKAYSLISPFFVIRPNVRKAHFKVTPYILCLTRLNLGLIIKNGAIIEPVAIAM